MTEMGCEQKMVTKSVFMTLLLSHCAGLLAAEIQGHVNDDQGAGLPGVRLCLSVAGTAPGDCETTRFTDRNGDYAFTGLAAGTPYTLRVLPDASLSGHTADPYPNYAWAPDSHEIVLASSSAGISGVDFSGSFSFSNFQSELRLTGADFPELSGYDLANDYVYLKVFTADSAGFAQDLIFLGQVSALDKLQIEVSAPLYETRVLYEIYSARQPETLTGSISLTSGV